MDDDDDVFGVSSSNRTVFLNCQVLHSLPLILFCQRGCLSSCPLSVMSPPDASACRTATCSSALLSPVSMGTSRAPALHELFFFDLVCLSDSVFVRIHPCFSRHGSLNNRSDSLSRHSSLWGFVAFPCDVSAAQPGEPPVREPRCPQTRRGIFWVQLLVLFQPQSLTMVVPLLLCQL